MRIRKIISILLATALIAVSLAGCGGQSSATYAMEAPQQPPPSSISEPSSSSSPDLEPGETLFKGKTDGYESEGYYYGDKNIDVLDIAYDEMTVSFILSEDKAKVRDVSIVVKNLNFIIGRDGQGQKADFNNYVLTYPKSYDIAPGVTGIILEELQTGGSCYLELEIDGDTAEGELHFVYEHNWNNDIAPVALGTRSLAFTSFQ